MFETITYTLVILFLAGWIFFNGLMTGRTWAISDDKNIPFWEVWEAEWDEDYYTWKRIPIKMYYIIPSICSFFSKKEAKKTRK